MYIPSKKAQLVEFFKSDKPEIQKWYHRPLEKLRDQTPYDVLNELDPDEKSIDLIFRAMESGLFLNSLDD